MLQDSVVRSKSSADKSVGPGAQQKAMSEGNTWRISGRVFSTNEGRTWSLGLSAPTEFWKGLGSRVLIKIAPDGTLGVLSQKVFERAKAQLPDETGTKVFGTGGTRQVAVAFNKVGARNLAPKTDATFKFLATRSEDGASGQLPEDILGIEPVSPAKPVAASTSMTRDDKGGVLGGRTTAPPIKPYTDFGTLQKAVAEVNRQLQVLGIDPDVSMVDGKVELRVRLR